MYSNIRIFVPHWCDWLRLSYFFVCDLLPSFAGIQILLKKSPACPLQWSLSKSGSLKVPGIFLHAYSHTYIYIHSAIQSYLHTVIHTYIHTYCHTVIQSYTNTVIMPYSLTCIQSYIHTVMLPYTQLPMRSLGPDHFVAHESFLHTWGRVKLLPSVVCADRA